MSASARLATVGLLLGILSPLATPNAAAPSPLGFATQARIEVDAQGAVSAVETDSTLSPEIGLAIKKTVRAWRFVPPVAAGRAVTGATFVQLSACAIPENGNYRFVVAYRGNGPARTGPAAPRVPVKAMRNGDEVKMKISYTVTAEGAAKLDGVEFVEGANTRNTGAIRESIADWLKASQFSPEQLDGKPVATKVLLPMQYKAGETRTFSSHASAVKYYAARDKLQAKPLQPACTMPGAQDDRQVSLDSPLQLMPTKG